MTDITIPDSVTTIGRNAFSCCYSLTNIIIPNTVSTIGKRIFSSCTSLTSITIPNSISTIGDGAFSGCSSLESITCLAVTPPELGEYVFWNVPTNIPLFVPESSIPAYQAANGWNIFILISHVSKIEDEFLTVKELELVQNYPNPFNPNTSINFSIPKYGNVNLTVYNSKGELIKELVNKKLSAGKHSINFDGTSLNSGVYFYKLNAENKQIVKKMTLVK